MGPNLPSALDNLAANGVINFDAGAYIQGKPARYVGEPKAYLPFEQPLNIYQGGPLSGQPAHDAFINQSHKPAGAADWKKAATAVLLGGLAVLGGVKYKDKITSMFKKKPAPVAAPVTPPAPPVAKASSKIKSIFKTIGDKVKAMPKWAKITGGIALGVITLVQTAKAVMISKVKKAQAEHEQKMATDPQYAQAFQQYQQQIQQASQAVSQPVATPATEIQQTPQP